MSDVFVPAPDDIIINEQGQLNPYNVQALRDTVEALTRAINGQINLGDGTTGTQAGNLNAVYSTITTPGANVEFAVKHTLGRIPIGFDVTMRDKAAVVYGSRPLSWTASLIYLKCSIATTTITVRIY
jgi:hypothetical protein